MPGTEGETAGQAAPRPHRLPTLGEGGRQPEPRAKTLKEAT